jgi:di/tricarboxylate transporter
MPVKAVAQSYAHPTIFLFMGAFVLALAVEKWSLHRRIALSVLSKSGTDGRKLILGFMVTAALLSMWMTNTSTAMLLLPIAASVAAMVAEKAVGVSGQEKRTISGGALIGARIRNHYRGHVDHHWDASQCNADRHLLTKLTASRSPFLIGCSSGYL